MQAYSILFFQKNFPTFYLQNTERSATIKLIYCFG